MDPSLPEYDPRLAGGLLYLCGPAREGGPPLPELADEADGRRLCRLLEWHGLTPEPEIPAGAAGISPRTLDEIRRVSLIQHARSSRLISQLREVGGALGAARVESIVLKGTAALLWLYPSGAPRRNDDLDLLVRSDDFERAAAALASLGFDEIGEEEPPPPLPGAASLRLAFGRHVIFGRPGAFPVELHTELFEGRGEWARAEDEVWAGAVTLGEPPVRRLAPDHFVLHAAVHQMKHVGHGTATLKGWVDLVYCLARREGSGAWETLRETASRWGVRDDLETALSTLKEHWGLDLPADATTKPLPLPLLVDPRARGKFQGPGYPLSEYLLDLRRAGARPGFAALAALLRYSLPRPDALRRRYGIGPGRPLFPYYLRRPFDVAGRLLKSVVAELRARMRQR